MKARAWAGGFKIGAGTPPAVMDVINLYTFCEMFHALPSQVLAESPETLRAFRIIRKAVNDKAG